MKDQLSQLLQTVESYQITPTKAFKALGLNESEKNFFPADRISFTKMMVKIVLILMIMVLFFIPIIVKSQCTSGCGQSTTSNTMPGTNGFSNTFCITTSTTLTYNQNFDMNSGTTCVGPNVTFSSTGGNWNGNWVVNNYGSFSRGITLNVGQVFNNYGTFTGTVSLNGGTIVNYSGATFSPASFSFNSGSFTNNSGGTTTITSSVTVNSGATFVSNGTLTIPGLTLNSSATATLGGSTTINGSVTNNGALTIAGLITVTGNFNQNTSGSIVSQAGTQCNTLNVSGTIQGQGSYNGANGLLLTKTLSPSCPTCLVNGTSTSPAGQPANQIAAPTLTALGNTITGTIVNPGGSPAATNYIVLRRFGAPVADSPSTYINYSVGNTIGTSTVVAVNPIATLSFTDANVINTNGCGTYYYAVFPYSVSTSCGTYKRTLNATNKSSIAISSTSGNLPSSSTICSGNTSGTLTLNNYIGAVTRWEYSVSPFSSWTTIANTTNTYTSGTLTQTTLFRAVVNAGTGCSAVNTITDTITVNSLPSVPTGSGVSRCGNGTLTLTATPGSGETIDWYAAATGGTALLSGNTSYTTSSLSSTTIFYAEARNTTTGCVSASRLAITATVYPSPSITLGNFNTICSGVTSTTLTYSAATNSPDQYMIDWSTPANTAGFSDVGWTSLSGGVINISGIVNTPGAYAATVYVRNSSNGCQTDVSNGRTITCGTANENSSITLTAPSGQIFTTIDFASYGLPNGTCGAFTIGTCHAATSTTVVQNAFLGLNTATLAATNTNFGDPCVGTGKRLYVQAVSNSQILNISLPTITGTTPSGGCNVSGTFTISATASAGATVDWYANPTGGTPLLSNSNSFTTPVIAVSTTYYAEARSLSGGCVSASRTAVAASITNTPTTPVAVNGSRCGTGTVVISSTPGTSETIDWYAASTGGTALATGSTSFTTPSISTNTTYYAEARNTLSGCISQNRVAVLATVNAIPSLTLGNFSTICAGTSSVSLSYSSPVNSPNQYYVDWSDAANTAGFADVNWTNFSGGTINVSGISNTAGTYAASILVRNSSTGCQSNVSNGYAVSCATVTENATASLTAPTSGQFVTINFASYGLPNGTCGAFSIGTCHAATSLNVVKTAFLGQSSASLVASNGNFGDPCVGTGKRLYIEAVSVTQLLTIQAAPTVTASSGGSRCGTGTVSLSATPVAGATIDWYAAASGGTALSTGSTTFTTPTISSTTTYYAEARNTVTGCVSISRTAVVATVTAPIITSFTPSSGGGSTVVTITGSNFTGATSVTVGGIAVTSFTVNSATQITATLATGSANAAASSIVVTSPCGTGSKSGFTYYLVPTVTGFTPASGYIGNTVTITGTNFTGATNVTFGGTAAASFSVISSTSIVAVIGTGSSGNVNVINAAGTGGLAGFTYLLGTVWTGAVDTAWGNTSNWNNGLPSTTSTAFIQNVSNVPTLSTNQTIPNLILRSGAVINIASGKTLTLTGNLTDSGTINGPGNLQMNGVSAQTISGVCTINNLIINNASGVTVSNVGNNTLKITGTLTPTAGILNTNGNLELKSSATGTARVAQGSSAGNYINGNVVYERFIPAHRSWKMVTMPFNPSGAPTINASLQEGAGGTTNNPNPGYGTQITGGSSANGFDQTSSNSPSMKEVINGAWSNVTNTNQAITNRQGYCIFIRGSRAINLSQGSGAVPDNTVLRGTGPIRQGNQTVSITGTSWQMVGNPFPSVLDLNAIATTNSSLINNNFKFWDPKLGGTNNVGGYVTASYNGSSYDFAPTSVSSLSQYAQSGSVFFVDSKGSGTLNINESHKASGGSDNVFRTGSLQPKLHIDLQSANAAGVYQVVDGVMVGYDDMFSDALDNYDVSKLMMGGMESIAISRDSQNLSIERRQTIQNNDTVYLKLNNLGQHGYKMNIVAENFDSTNISAWMLDTETGSTTPIDLSGNTVFSFYISAGYNHDKYRIIFNQQQNVVLPVTLTSFRAQISGKSIQTSWEVENEQNITTYDVEKSADGIHFGTVKSVTATGNMNNSLNYSWLDVNPYNGANFYRLRINDLNGHTKYSAIVKLVMNSNKLVQVFPNPINNNIIHLQLLNQDRGNYDIRLMNYAGQLVKNQTCYFNGNDGNMDVNVDPNLPKGMYSLECTDPSKKKTIIKIIID